MLIRCILGRPFPAQSSSLQHLCSPERTSDYSLLAVDLFTSYKVQLPWHCVLNAECGSAATFVTLSNDLHARAHTHTGTSQMLHMSFWSLFVCCCCSEYRQKLNHILEKSHLGIICFIPNARKLPLSRLAHSQQWFPPTHLSQHDFPKVEHGDRDDAAFSWHSSNIFSSFPDFNSVITPVV